MVMKKLLNEFITWVCAQQHFRHHIAIGFIPEVLVSFGDAL